MQLRSEFEKKFIKNFHIKNLKNLKLTLENDTWINI